MKMIYGDLRPLKFGWNFRVGFDAPWRVGSLRRWLWSDWYSDGLRSDDLANVRHYGRRVAGFTWSAWVVSLRDFA